MASGAESAETIAVCHRWRRRVVIGSAAALGLLLATVAVQAWRRLMPNYNQLFQAAIAGADRVVIRDGGFDCCGSIEGQRVLFETSDPTEIQQLREHIEFMETRPKGYCMCCGYPGIDWYRNGERVVLSSLQHGQAIRWKCFPGDVALTGQSASWLSNWLRAHGVPESRRGPSGPATSGTPDDRRGKRPVSSTSSGAA